MDVKMVVFAVAAFVTWSSCAVGCPESRNAMLFNSDGSVLSFCHTNTGLNLWSMKDQPMAVQLHAMFKEMESLRCEQTTLQQQQNALNQMHMTGGRQKGAQDYAEATHVLTYGANGDDEDDDLHLSGAEQKSKRRGDPCFHYTVLDQAWRATNTTTKYKMCDRNIKWKGWYRLFYNGKSLQMPERCVPVNKCGTNSPLWLAGPHPKLREGIVTRKVCGHWKKNCCAFRSNPIKVKKCRGNYYVYQFTPPSTCYLAYCADINTLACGRCRRNQACVSRDKINWRCKRKKTLSSKKIHFFASFPGKLVGKVNRIKYSKVLVNVGRGFDRRTGVFRAPVKGVYQFFFSSQTSNTSLKTDLWLVVNGYWVAVCSTRIPRVSSVGSMSTYMTFLRKGSVVYVTHNCGRSWASAASMTITFGGSLLAQFG